MLDIKSSFRATFSVLALMALVGCGGGDAACCDGKVVSLSKESISQDTENTVNLGVTGDVNTLTPTGLGPSSTSLPPFATILVNNCDKESVVQGCKALHFEVQGNDPDGNSDNLTFAWSIDDIFVSDKKSFCHKVKGLGSHIVKVVVTDEDNATGSDSVEVLVEY